MTLKIRLTDLEIQHADQVALEVIRKADAKGCRNFTVPKDREKTHKMGCRAELAFAKLLGLKWNDFCFETRKQGDVGGVEVRCTDYPTGRLLICPRDLDSRPYMLVRAHRRPEYKFIGWMYGKDGKRSEWERDKGHAISSVYFIPNEALRDPYELFERLSIQLENIS